MRCVRNLLNQLMDFVKSEGQRFRNFGNNRWCHQLHFAPSKLHRSEYHLIEWKMEFTCWPIILSSNQKNQLTVNVGCNYVFFFFLLFVEPERFGGARSGVLCSNECDFDYLTHPMTLTHEKVMFCCVNRLKQQSNTHCVKSGARVVYMLQHHQRVTCHRWCVLTPCVWVLPCSYDWWYGIVSGDRRENIQFTLIELLTAFFVRLWIIQKSETFHRSLWKGKGVQRTFVL